MQNTLFGEHSSICCAYFINKVKIELDVYPGHRKIKTDE